MKDERQIVVTFRGEHGEIILLRAREDLVSLEGRKLTWIERMRMKIRSWLRFISLGM